MMMDSSQRMKTEEQDNGQITSPVSNQNPAISQSPAPASASAPTVAQVSAINEISKSQQPIQTTPNSTPYSIYPPYTNPVNQPYYSQLPPTAIPTHCQHGGVCAGYGYVAVAVDRATDSPMVRENPFRMPPEEPPQQGYTGFLDKEIRAKFIRKVYIILTLQLLFTLGLIALFIYEPHVKQFVQQNIYLYYVAFAIFFPVYIGLVCYQEIRRRFPLNIIALIVFTMAMSYMCATISTIYDTDIVLMAAGICAVVCFSVTIFSFYTKFDFTKCGGVLCILLLILIGFGIIAIFFQTMFLAYDTQMMMGGKYYELSAEEYVFAVVQLYIDIVYMFLFILMLTGAHRE